MLLTTVYTFLWTLLLVIPGIMKSYSSDNALLRELKAEIKKLTALVARTVPAIAEGLEKLRSRVPVSYTHLDVYKRQGLCSVPTAGQR